jgi:hypothetical protein
MSYQQRNKLLNDNGYNEIFTFLNEELKILEFDYSNMKSPRGKEATELKRKGEKLIALMKLHRKLGELGSEKSIGQTLQNVRLYTRNTKEYNKHKGDWGVLHNKQLEVADKYLQAKREYKAMYD